MVVYKASAPPKDVSIETVKKALCYLEYSLAQKMVVDISIIILSLPISIKVLRTLLGVRIVCIVHI